MNKLGVTNNMHNMLEARQCLEATVACTVICEDGNRDCLPTTDAQHKLRIAARRLASVCCVLAPS
jgi:hypothetical protein